MLNNAAFKDDKLLAAACRFLGLVFKRDPESFEPKVCDKHGEELDAYDEDGTWIDYGICDAEALGEAKSFSMTLVHEKGWREIEKKNPFFGVKSSEELALKLDLLGVRTREKPKRRRRKCGRKDVCKS